MKGNVVFSIITICYNSSQTIERTIKSVLNQSFTDFEYIIVDGGSHDSTLDIIRKYQNSFGDRLIWKSEPDKGIYDAMNKGINISNGVIVGIVNSDDWLEDNALENVYKVYVEHHNDENALYCGGIIFHTKKGKCHILMPNISLFKRSASIFVMKGIRHPATFVPLKVYNRIGTFDSSFSILADTDFILRAYYQKVHLIEIPFVISNMSDGGISNALTWKSGMKSFKDKKKMLAKFNISTVKRIVLLFHAALIIITKRLMKFNPYIKHA